MSDFKPIISHNNKKSKLQTKEVKISGTNDFSPINVNRPFDEKSASSTPKIEIDPKNDPRKKATMTAKLSPYVNLKIQTLKPFMAEAEGVDASTINETLDLLVDSYVDKRLSARQAEAYNQMVQTQFAMMPLKKRSK